MMSDLGRSSSDAQPLFGSTRYFGSVSEPRPPNDCSPWVRPFPPRLPPGVASPCSVASQVSGRRRRPLKGSPPSAAQTERAVFPHSAFMNGFARSVEKGSVRQRYLVHQRRDLLLLTFERHIIG